VTLRKVLSIVLLLVFGLAAVAPLLAAGQDADAGLPACCRRNGAHHCAMGIAGMRGMGGMRAMADASDAPRWKAPASRCPYCPVSVVRGHVHDVSGPPLQQVYVLADFSRPAGQAQTECKRRMALDRSRHKRGPPFSFSV
jgi:hypothetical protein